jgi:hypothetical protein
LRELKIEYFSENKENIDEWSIIELQGDLEVKQGEVGLSNKLLGDLYFTKEVWKNLFLL